MSHPARVGVVGAGLMGHALALVYALGGHPVGIYDNDGARLTDLAERARVTAAPLLAAGSVSEADLAAALDRIAPSADLGAVVAGSVFVVEAVAENLAVKQAIFEALDRLAPPAAVLASNSSALSPDELATVTRRPERVLVTHWFNPPTMLPLVEVVRARTTSDEAVALAVEQLRALGKRPVVIPRYTIGYVANRLQHAMIRECVALIDSGLIGPADLDDVMRFSLAPRWAALGVLRTMDLGNTSLFATTCRTILPDLSNADGPGPTLTAMAEDGRHGVTTGQGFYSWTPEEIKAARDLRDATIQAVLALTKPE
jgi:3-hydroxybutyryl-CoA dehydrogenase